MDTTANRLKQIMEERGLRQIDILNLAEPYCEKYDVKLGRNAISQYVSGKVVPGQDKLFVLAQALHVSEAWLMGIDEEDLIHQKSCRKIDILIEIESEIASINSGEPFYYDGKELSDETRRIFMYALRMTKTMLEKQIDEEGSKDAGI